MKFKVEHKIFLTCLITYLFFSTWVSWDEESTYALLKSIFNGKFNINEYVNLTGTNYNFNGNFYSGYEPYAGFISLPLYAISKFFPFQAEKNGLEHHIHNEKFVYEFPNSLQYLKFLLTAGTSGLFSSLIVILIYRLGKILTSSKKARIFAALTIGLGTSLFAFARSFLIDAFVAFFLFLSFFLILKEKRKKNSYKQFFIAGIFFGVALGITILVVAIFFAYIFYVFFVQRKSFLFFFLGIVVGYSPVAIAYYPLFGSPFGIIIGPAEWQTLTPLKELPFTPSWTIPLRVLFFPLRGLFFYSPVLLLSILGIFEMWRNNLKYEVLFILSLLLIISVGLTFHSQWWGGFVFGPEYLLQVTPFLSLPLIYQIKRRFNLFLPLFVISIFIYFLGLQYYEPGVVKIDEEYRRKLEGLQPIGNPLFEHYLPLTLINGPRSILLENLIIDKKISIDFKHPYNPDVPEFVPPGSPIMRKFEVYLFSLPKIGIIVLRLPWLSMFIVALVLILIWKKEIFSKIKIKPIIFFSIIVLLFFLFFIRVRNFAYGDNWCAPQWYEDEKRIDEGRWIGKNATLFLFSKKDEDKNLRFMAESFEKNQILEIYLNGKIIGNYTIENRKEILQPIKLREGVNEILLNSKGNFIKPWYIGVGCDLDIIFKISKISIF